MTHPENIGERHFDPLLPRKINALQRAVARTQVTTAVYLDKLTAIVRSYPLITDQPLARLPEHLEFPVAFVPDIILSESFSENCQTRSSSWRSCICIATQTAGKIVSSFNMPLELSVTRACGMPCRTARKAGVAMTTSPTQLGARIHTRLGSSLMAPPLKVVVSACSTLTLRRSAHSPIIPGQAV
jgi:hypothetical protein